METAVPARRRIPLRVGAALVAALAVLAVAVAPDKTRDAVAFLRSDPGDLWLDIQIAPPTGDGWNPAFELRQVILHARMGCIEPSGIWPSGLPLEVDALLTARGADRVILALARDRFFEEAVVDPPTPIDAPCVILVSGPAPREPAWRSALRWASARVLGASLLPPPETSPRTYGLATGWDPPRIVRRLRALRKAVDGDAERALDQLIRQIPSVPR